ncbi:MAG: hypothetical protein Q8R31_06575, partial [Candidatus Omnitrophota bacterium]|nr:hypothetical protein [Candidatus Omnitrophota bacterium]
HGKVIAESKLSKNNKIVKKDKKIEELLNAREYVNIGPMRAHKPAKGHIWRKLEHARVLKEMSYRKLTFENSKKLTS